MKTHYLEKPERGYPDRVRVSGWTSAALFHGRLADADPAKYLTGGREGGGVKFGILPMCSVISNV